jgi:hypothetical protein
MSDSVFTFYSEETSNNLSSMVGYKKIEEQDLKVGNRLKAHWDGAFHEITKIEGDLVDYKGVTYDGEYKDKKSVMLECFDLVEL